jgi:hypothetical protein
MVHVIEVVGRCMCTTKQGCGGWVNWQTLPEAGRRGRFACRGDSGVPAMTRASHGTSISSRKVASSSFEAEVLMSHTRPRGFLWELAWSASLLDNLAVSLNDLEWTIDHVRRGFFRPFKLDEISLVAGPTWRSPLLAMKVWASRTLAASHDKDD